MNKEKIRPRAHKPPTVAEAQSHRHAWDMRGLEDVQSQRQAQVTWWTVMGGIAVGALLTQVPAIVEEVRSGHWQFLLHFIDSALILSYSWILVVWGSLVVRHPLTIISSFIILFCWSIAFSNGSGGNKPVLVDGGAGGSVFLWDAGTALLDAVGRMVEFFYLRM